MGGGSSTRARYNDTAAAAAPPGVVMGMPVQDDTAAAAPPAAEVGFTEEQMRACVLDGGTRFVAPGQVTYVDEEYGGGIREVSDERKALTDEDVLRVLSALGDAVDFDLAGCELLTDAIVKEIVRRCPNLKNLDVRCVGRARARARAHPTPPAHARAPPSGPVRVSGGARR